MLSSNLLLSKIWREERDDSKCVSHEKMSHQMTDRLVVSQDDLRLEIFDGLEMLMIVKL